MIKMTYQHYEGKIQIHSQHCAKQGVTETSSQKSKTIQWYPLIALLFKLVPKVVKKIIRRGTRKKATIFAENLSVYIKHPKHFDRRLL